MSPSTLPARIYAAALCAVLHLALLSALLMSPHPTRNFALIPEQTLQFVLLEHENTEHDKDLALERPAPPIAEREKVAAAALPPAQAKARQKVFKKPSPETSTAIVAYRVDEAPIAIDDVQPRTYAVEMPASQREMLTRRVIEWAQGLRDEALAQAHLSWLDAGQRYDAVLTRRPAASSMDIEREAVEIATEQAGRRLQTQLEMKRLAFSHFTQLVDRWDNEVQLHDDEIAGRFHSNSQIFLGYDRNVVPRFLGKVTTAARGIVIANASGRRSRAEIFRAGLETRAGQIELPQRFVPFAADSGMNGEGTILSFPHGARITFYPDGSYGWRAPRSNAPEKRQLPAASPVYFVGARGTTFYVHGAVRGTVLVYSPQRIVIEGNLVYARDPRAAAEANDYLGLVSDRYVEIARPAVTGPGNLEIHAAIYARRRFIVTDEDYPQHATLLIYGSLTAGSLTATEPRYATKVQFDSRFERRRPPGFPLTDRYEIEAWNAQWQSSASERNPQAHELH